MDPQRRSRAETLFKNIDAIDYYQLLGVAKTASLSDVKSAYHTLSREFHPDNLGASVEPELKTVIMTIAKRINEAYTVLRDWEARKVYDGFLAMPAGTRKLRMPDGEEAKPQPKEDPVKSPQARKLFLQAQTDAKIGRKAQAINNLKLALVFEPGNEAIKKMLVDLGES